MGAYSGSALASASNLLYIENSNSNTPLVYGDFANDSLKVNGTLSIGDSIFFPTTRGTNGQYLQTNASGQLSWGSASGDNLGNHQLDSNVRTNGHYISNDGDDEGLFVTTDGNVAIGTNSTPSKFYVVNNSVDITGFFQTTITSGASSAGIVSNVNGLATDNYGALLVSNGNGTNNYGVSANVANATGSNYGFRTVVSGSSANATYGLYASASGADTNWAGYFNDGNVYIKDSLDVDGFADIDELRINSAYIFPTTAPTVTGQVLQYNGTSLQWGSVAEDDLGNHTATTNINLNGNYLSGDGAAEGIHVDADGDVTVGSNKGFRDFSVWGENGTGGIDISYWSEDGKPEVTYGAHGSGSSSGTEISFFKAGGTWTSQSAVADGDNVLTMGTTLKYDASNSVSRDFFVVDIDGTPSGINVPTSLTFNTRNVSGITNSLVMKSSGNVGIGTTSPDSLLDVEGGAEINRLNINKAYTFPTTGPTNTNDVLIYNGSDLKWGPASSVFTTDNDTISAGSGNQKFVFGSTNTEDITGTTDDNRMFFDITTGSFRAGQATGDAWNAANLGTNSTAFGLNSRATGNYSFASGDSAWASGTGATAFGQNATASGNFSVAMGDGVTASGARSIVLGRNSSAVNGRAIAIGASNYSSGAFSITMGEENTTSADNAIAIGERTKASAANSTVIGKDSEAQGLESIVLGTNLIAQSAGEIVLGNFNDTLTTGFSTMSRSGTDRLLVIGNSTNAVSRSNALVMLKNGNTTLNGQLTLTGGLLSDGNVGIGTNSPNTSLHVMGSSITSEDTNGIGQQNLFTAKNTTGQSILFRYAYDATGNVPDSVWQFRSSGTDARDIEFTRFDTKVLMHLDMDDSAVGIGTSTPSSILDVDGDIETGDANAFYFGDPSTDGTWRIVRDGNDLSFERRESGTYVFKMKINP